MNKENSPNSIALVPFGDFSIFSKHNRYLAAILQQIHQAVIGVYGNLIDHSAPRLFVKFYVRCGGFVSSVSIPPMAMDSASIRLRRFSRATTQSKKSRK